ncbi:RNase H domain-containing protein [Trichonephila clavipes]|nr:RNase H domain-containing protein [Trichonephila clavipes]
MKGVLEALENYHDRCHPVVCTILDQGFLQQGFRYRVLLATKSRRNHRQRASGQRGKVGDDGSAASCSAIGYEASSCIIFFKIWQESWSQQLDNKLHFVKPVVGAWPVMPMRRTDVKFTRLRIGHTRTSHTGIC